MVIPDTGDAELPTIPTIRAETVTNRNPKTTISSAAAMFASSPTCAPGTGWNCRNATISTIRSAEPPSTTDIGRSCSVRTGFALTSLAPAPAPLALLARRDRTPSASAEMIVGAVRSSVINPAVATAPAPIGRI